MPKSRPRGSLADIANALHLRNAWVDIQLGKRGGSRRIPGSDGISLNNYAEALGDNLSILSQRLLAKTFAYQPLLPHFEEKTGGKFRVICVPTVRDRIVQRALLNHLLAHNSGRYKFSTDVSYGFIKNRSVGDAIEQAKKLRTAKPWAYKADIASFFDAIPRDKMKAAISAKIRLRAIVPLLHSACDCEAKAHSQADKLRLRQQGIKEGQGLRQGMPLSPYFSNIYLEGFDKQAIASQISMVRYADDFVVFANSEAECKSVDSFCRTELARLDLEVHPLGTKDKCEIRAPDQPVEFLGVELALKDGAYAFRLSDQQIEKKRRALLQLGNVDELLKQRLTITKFALRLGAKIDGWLDSYEHCENLAEFKQKVENWRVHVIEQVFIAGLGLPNEKLNRRARQFLELAPLPKRV